MIKVYALAAFHPALKGVIRDIRPVWTLEELGLPYDRIVMNAMEREHKSPDYLALNPFGKVPTLRDGEFTLFESSAICTYLGDKAKKLLPDPTSPERAYYNQWVSFAVSTLEPMAFRLFDFDFFAEKNVVTSQMRQGVESNLNNLLKGLDSVLQKRPYLLGESFSLADLVISAVMQVIRHTDLLARHSAVAAYIERNWSRSAYARALANNG